MSSTESEYRESRCDIFYREAFKIDVRYIDGICYRNDEISILSVFQSDIRQFNIW